MHLLPFGWIGVFWINVLSKHDAEVNGGVITLDNGILCISEVPSETQDISVVTGCRLDIRYVKYRCTLYELLGSGAGVCWH